MSRTATLLLVAGVPPWAQELFRDAIWEILKVTDAHAWCCFGSICAPSSWWAQLALTKQGGCLGGYLDRQGGAMHMF